MEAEMSNNGDGLVSTDAGGYPTSIQGDPQKLAATSSGSTRRRFVKGAIATVGGAAAAAYVKPEARQIEVSIAAAHSAPPLPLRTQHWRTPAVP